MCIVSNIRLDNIERMMRAKQHRDAQLKQRFDEEDERELKRKAGKLQLIEQHRMASLEATYRRQELVDKLEKARGRSALEKLHLANEAWVYFFLLGGFVYFDDQMSVIGVNSLTLTVANVSRLRLSGPYPASAPSIREMRGQGRMRP